MKHSIIACVWVLYALTQVPTQLLAADSTYTVRISNDYLTKFKNDRTERVFLGKDVGIININFFPGKITKVDSTITIEMSREEWCIIQLTSNGNLKSIENKGAFLYGYLYYKNYAFSRLKKEAMSDAGYTTYWKFDASTNVVITEDNYGTMFNCELNKEYTKVTVKLKSY